MRNLGDNEKVIEPSKCREWAGLYLHCMNNVERVDGRISYMLLEMRMFESYKRTSDSSSDFFFFPPRNHESQWL